RLSTPGAPGEPLGARLPPEDFSAFMWMAALPPTLDTRAGRGRASDLEPGSASVDPAASRVVDFWRQAGPELWFSKDPGFDGRFRERFLALHEAAARGELAHWARWPDGALALLLLLDQYPRNAFRGTPRMYATDELARSVAERAIEAGHDRLVDVNLRLFMYLPFGHSERLSDQERSVELNRSLGEPSLSHALHHQQIVQRFGRFPHRNPILNRAMRPEEQAFLDAGGFAG
ncbi:MAG TPA: DUF924 family protein, partial [Polyangiales bacterium]